MDKSVHETAEEERETLQEKQEHILRYQKKIVNDMEARDIRAQRMSRWLWNGVLLLVAVQLGSSVYMGDALMFALSISLLVFNAVAFSYARKRRKEAAQITERARRKVKEGEREIYDSWIQGNRESY